MVNKNDKSVNENLSNKNIELLIDKKIAEAKLIIAEKRLNYLMAFGAALLTIFGIVLPLFLTQTSTNRVNQAIERMDDKFNELAGKQLRKPKIVCYIDGNRLVNSVIHFDPSNLQKTILIKNEGDGTADYIRIRLYINYKDDALIRDLGNSGFWKRNISDKPAFSTMLIYERDDINLLPAKDSIPVKFWMQNPHLRKSSVQTAAILMIFYGEPVPIEVPFTFEIMREKS
jgi:hypothetical protein